MAPPRDHNPVTRLRNDDVLCGVRPSVRAFRPSSPLWRRLPPGRLPPASPEPRSRRPTGSREGPPAGGDGLRVRQLWRSHPRQPALRRLRDVHEGGRRRRELPELRRSSCVLRARPMTRSRSADRRSASRSSEKQGFWPKNGTYVRTSPACAGIRAQINFCSKRGWAGTSGNSRSNVLQVGVGKHRPCPPVGGHFK